MTAAVGRAARRHSRIESARVQIRDFRSAARISHRPLQDTGSKPRAGILRLYQCASFRVPARQHPDESAVMGELSAVVTEPGQPVPPFDLPATDGRRVSTASLEGQPYVVYFYPKDDTPGCTKEAIAFTQLSHEFEALGVLVVGISRDPLAKHEKFRAKHDLGLVLASDEGGKACAAFGIWVEKSMYGRKYMGIERSTFLVNAAGEIVQAWRKVKVTGHAEAVLVAARAMAGATD